MPDKSKKDGRARILGRPKSELYSLGPTAGLGIAGTAQDGATVTPRRKVKTLQDAVNGTISGALRIGAGNCRTCLRILPPGSRLRYCSGSCRLRAWAVRELTKAMDEGAAEGLRDELRACLARAMKKEAYYGR